ncbi:hypothetical protein vseg_013757 [Gypsophila vaccaria]
MWMASISSNLYRRLFLNQTHSSSLSRFPKSFFSTSHSDDPHLPPISDSPEIESVSSSSSSFPEHRADAISRTTLEGGIDVGVYKAVIVGQVGQNPVQKRLKNGKSLTLTTVGTGGIRNERIPFPSEEPGEYANRCNIQWHRVSVYPDRLGDMIMKHAQPGVLLYLEGNLETKIFTDPITGLVRRIREIAIRRNGRIVFLGNGGDFTQPSPNELRGVGYF